MSDEAKRPEEETLAEAEASLSEEELVDVTEGEVQAEAGDEGPQEALDHARIEGLEAEIAEFREQLLRSHAEMQNVRRRAENDVEKARKYALERFVKELLPVVDSLEKAIEASGDQDESSPQVANMREGVEMTLSLLLGSMKKFDVEVVNPQDQPFNPDFHEAMSMVPNPDVAPNTVIAVLQKGYTLSGRLVRPAMVMVSKGV